MAWNKPSNGEAASSPLRGKGGASVLKRRGRRFPVRITGAVVVLGAAVAAWWLWPSEETRQDAASTKKGLIREVKPAAVRTNETTTSTLPGPKELPPQKIGEIRNGMLLLPNGKMHKVVGIVTNAAQSAKPDYAIFDHMSENVIAGLLALEPGRTLVGTPRYDGRFTKDFLESLSTPIIPTKDDDEYVRNLKKLVNQAKIELKTAYDRGEDIEQILIDSRKEFQRLARYKDELKTMTLQGINSASTPEEVEDYITAANKMLEEKGIAPLDDLSELGKLKLQMIEREK